jgi:hypothetical protein
MMSHALDACHSALINGLLKSAPKAALDKKGYVSRTRSSVEFGCDFSSKPRKIPIKSS